MKRGCSIEMIKKVYGRVGLERIQGALFGLLDMVPVHHLGVVEQ